MKDWSYSKWGRYCKCPALFYFVDVIGLKEMLAYPLILGKVGHEVVKICHDKSTEEHPMGFTSKQGALDVFEEMWDGAVAENSGQIFEESETKELEHKETGLTGISNYWNRMESKSEEPAVVEQFRTIDFEGIRFKVKFDQIRKIPKKDRKKWRPDLAWRKRLPERVILDLKFSKKPPFSVSENDKSVVRLEKDELTLDLYNQGVIYTLAYEKSFNRTPLGFALYYVVSDVIGFVHLDRSDYKKVAKAIKDANKEMIHDKYPKKISNRHCRSCSFLIDCLGVAGALQDVSVKKLPVVQNGAASWQLERGVCESVQTRFPV